MYLNSDLIQQKKKNITGVYGFAGFLGKFLVHFFVFYPHFYMQIYSRNLK